jgi:cobalt/nickel transport protein
MNSAKVNLILVFLVIVLIAAPLVINQGAEFGGADGQAEEVITQIRPDYQPWFQLLWEPPSGEIESLLFALQAAIGSGFIGYYFGYARGRRDRDAGKGVKSRHALN